MTNILVDCKNLALFSGGISEYYKPLMKEYIAYFKDYNFILISPKNFDTEFISKLDNWEIKLVPYINTGSSSLDIVLYDLFFLPKAMSQLPGDYILSPYYDFLIPKKYANKTMITVHDMCYWEVSEQYPLKIRLYYTFLLKTNIKRCFKVITVSKSSLNSIVKKFGEKINEKISVVYNIFHEIERYDGDEKSYKSKYVRILYTGGFEKRKNVDMMFSALESLKDRLDFKLQFTGDFSSNSELNNLIAKYNLNDSVELVGRLSKDELALYYKSCDLVINISLCEGFGRSNLEAIQYKKPLVCSDIPVFKELIGDYAFFCNPRDKVDIAMCITRALKAENKENYFCYDRFSLKANSLLMIKEIEEMVK